MICHFFHSRLQSVQNPRHSPLFFTIISAGSKIQQNKLLYCKGVWCIELLYMLIHYLHRPVCAQNMFLICGTIQFLMGIMLSLNQVQIRHYNWHISLHSLLSLTCYNKGPCIIEAFCNLVDNSKPSKNFQVNNFNSELGENDFTGVKCKCGYCTTVSPRSIIVKHILKVSYGLEHGFSQTSVPRNNEKLNFKFNS